MRIRYFIPIFFVWFLGNSQTENDMLLTQKIPELLQEKNQEGYQQAKQLLLDIEAQLGSLPEHKFKLLRYSYENGDMAFFKKELLLLVENYGFDLTLLDKRVNYYEALTTGLLSDWFKNVYPPARKKWLNNNYDKIPYLKALNNLYVKDQALASIAGRINSDSTIDITSKDKLKDLLINESKELFSELIRIYSEIGSYPSAKTFSLPQIPYFLVETHLLKIPEISLTYLEQIYPFYENTYLNNKIDYLVFRNYDIQMLMSSGKQYFGTIQNEEVPETFLDENGNIPILDEENFIKRREKLGWE